MKYNKNQGNSIISTRRSQVMDIKNFMIQNVDTILEKEERLNFFLDGTDDSSTTVSNLCLCWCLNSASSSAWDKLQEAKI